MLRQTYYDAQWYASQANTRQTNRSLDAINAQAALPKIFEATNHHQALLAANIAKEFKMAYIIKGAGDSYQNALRN